MKGLFKKRKAEKIPYITIPESFVIYMEFPEKCESMYEVKDRYQVCIANGKYYVRDKYHTPEDNKFFSETLRSVFTEGIEIEEIMSTDEHIRYVIEREVFGYKEIQPLLEDPYVINIHIHANRPVQIVHQAYGRLVYPIELSRDEVSELIRRFAASSGVPVSERLPIVSFIDIASNARVSAIYSSDVTIKQSAYLDIRKQPVEPWTIFKLIELETVHPLEAAILWFTIKHKMAIMVTGGMFTGKTTLINAMMGFVPPGSRVMTIEDTPELRVPNEIYWIRTMTRERVDMPEANIRAFDLLKQAVRMSVDYVIVGEVRGEDARDWAQAILLGHGGVTSFHASDPRAAITRLVTPPISIDSQALEHLSVFVHMIPIYKPGRGLARISYLFINEGGSPVEICSPMGCSLDKFVETSHVERIIQLEGYTRDKIKREIKAMEQVIQMFLGMREKPRFSDVPSLLYKWLGELMKK